MKFGYTLTCFGKDLLDPLWSLIRNRSEISGPVVMSVPYPRVILPDDLVQNQVISQQHSYHISAILRRSEEFAHVGRPTGLV